MFAYIIGVGGMLETIVIMLSKPYVYYLKLSSSGSNLRDKDIDSTNRYPMFGIRLNCVTVLPLEYSCPVWVDLLNKNKLFYYCTLNCFMGRDGAQMNSVTLHDNCCFGMIEFRHKQKLRLFHLNLRFR
jgi:hypothetical protein